jgi:hypothetical protein
MIRFTILFCFCLAGFHESIPDDRRNFVSSGDAGLDSAISAKVLEDVREESSYTRADTTKWYWSLDLEGIRTDSVADSLRRGIRAAARATAGDTVTARVRRSIYVALPQIAGDSAVVNITYKHSWESSCSWYHSSSSHQYVFGRARGIWRFVRDNEHLISDPPPPPPPSVPRVCYERGDIR